MKQDATAILAIVAVVDRPRQSELGQHRTEMGADPCLIPRVLSGICDVIANVLHAFRDGLGDRRRVVASHRCREIEIQVDVVPAGPDHSPLVAEQADPLGRGQPHRVLGELSNRVRGVVGHVIAAAVGVGERRAAPLDLERPLPPIDQLVLGLAAGALERHWQHPGLRCR